MKEGTKAMIQVSSKLMNNVFAKLLYVLDPRYDTEISFKNEVFSIRPHASECGTCDCGLSVDVLSAIHTHNPFIHKKGCKFHEPNFDYHSQNGDRVFICWYKRPVRGTWSNVTLTPHNFATMIDTCIDSLAMQFTTKVESVEQFFSHSYNDVPYVFDRKTRWIYGIDDISNECLTLQRIDRRIFNSKPTKVVYFIDKNDRYFWWTKPIGTNDEEKESSQS